MADTLHTLKLENRNNLCIDGVTSVISYDDEQVTAVTDYGTLLIKGTALHIDELNVDTTKLNITGNIIALIYSQSQNKTSLFRRLFSFSN